MNPTTLTTILLYSCDTEVRRYIPDKLAKLNLQISIPALGHVVQSSNAPDIVRIESAEALGKLGNSIALPFFKNISSDKLDELRRTVIWSLGQIGGDMATDMLHSYFNDSYWMCHKWIPKSLARIQTEKAEQALQKYIISMPNDNRVKTEVVRAMTILINFSSNPNFWFNIFIEYLSLKSNVQLIRALLQFTLSSHKVLEWDSGISFAYQVLESNLPIPIKKEALSVLAASNNLKPVYSFLSIIPFRQHCLFLLAKEKQCEKFTISTVDDAISIIHGFISAIKEGYIQQSCHPRIDIVNFLSKEHDRPFVKIPLIEYQILLGIQDENILHLIQDPITKSSCLRNLKFLNINNSILKIIFKEATHGEKKIREILVHNLHTLYPKYPREIHNLLTLMSKHDRVWHIRRDARNSLIKFCSSVNIPSN